MDVRKKRMLYGAAISGGLAGATMSLYSAFSSIWAHALVAGVAGGFVGVAISCIVRCGRDSSR